MKLKVLMMIIAVLAAGAAPASASILEQATEWLLPIEAYLDVPEDAGSWTQNLTFPTGQAGSMQFRIFAWSPVEMQQTVTRINLVGGTVTLEFSLGDYTGGTWNPETTPSFVLEITNPGEWVGQAVFISPKHKDILTGGYAGNYGWVTWEMAGNPPKPKLGFSSDVDIHKWTDTQLAIFGVPTDAGEPYGYNVFVELLGGNAQHGVIPEPGSALIWALLALCGGAATVLYRRRRAA
jgi:hypothetical protein